MNHNMQPYVSLVENRISSLDFNSHPKELYEPIRYFLKLGGKRIRPILCMMGAELFGSKREDVIKAALSIEVFHNFSLIHDDIMDEAPIRRGQATVHEKWNRDIAILSGDVMFVKAFDLLCEQGGSNLLEVLRLFNATAIEVCEGQQMDMNFERSSEVNIDEYIEMIRLKTSVLLACSLKIGALLAGAPDSEAQKLYDFGQNLGIAFQIQDDYLDAYANPDQFGKQPGGDILANKKTFLLLKAYEKADKKSKMTLDACLKSSQPNKVEKVIAIYDKLGIPEVTRSEIDRYYQIAMSKLDAIETSFSKSGFIQLAKFLILRQH